MSSPGRLPRHTFAVALTCPDEPALLRLSLALGAAGIAHERIVEDDPPYTDQLLAIGIPPMSRRTLRPLLRDLPLLE